MQKILIAELASDMIAKREKENLNIRTAAKKCGISVTNFHGIEAKKVPKIEHFLKICNWLGKNVNHYFTTYQTKKVK